MAGFLDLIDNTLKAVFSKKPHDPSATRKPVLKGIDTALKQFSTGSVKAPNRWWKAANNVVAFTPKVGGQVLQINGEDTNYIPSERFPDFLAAFKKAVEAGEFDKELEAHGKGTASVAVPKAKGKRSISDEARERMRIAALKRHGKNPDGTPIKS